MCFFHNRSLQQKRIKDSGVLCLSLFVYVVPGKVKSSVIPILISYTLALELKYFESVSVDLSLCHNKDFSLSGVIF